MIRVIDCGSQLTQNIARRIREIGVFSDIVPFHTDPEKVLTKDLEGIIISGGQFSVHDEGSPKIDKRILDSRVPKLGICYGQQLIAYLLGGEVESSDNREYGGTEVKLIQDSQLFERLPSKTLKVWMSHGDIVKQVPEGFKKIAISENGHIAAMEDPEKGIYAVQFHPEVDHTQNGREILHNFVNICNASKTWDPSKDYDRLVEETKERIKGKVGVGGISGGVDSSTVSVLVKQIAGSDYHPIFVNNGVLRLNEADEVKASLEPFGLNIIYIDASQRFLEKLKGITDPDQKRLVIGHEFCDVFQEVADTIPDASYLIQGTLYPDVVESIPPFGASTSKIKRHHNVGGLSDKLGLEVIEPFRYMFKDEVRKIAEERLGIPREIVWRHPFPGPGVAIRISGEITEEKLRIYRQADAIFIDELKDKCLYSRISQAFAVLTNDFSVGVMGDEGTYEYVVGLRAVVTNDYMTSDIHRFNWEVLQSIANRIVNEVKGINRVTYDITQKPSGTIEWQ